MNDVTLVGRSPPQFVPGEVFEDGNLIEEDMLIKAFEFVEDGIESHITIPQKALMAAHPKRFYKCDLLNRILREVQKVKYGADQDSMNMIMRKGREYEANGGVFEISLKQLGSNTHLEKVYMHPKYIF